MCFFFLVLQNLYKLTFGPQHPAAHGVLCCLLYFIGEYILLVDINIGFLHRGVEKLCEFKTLEQTLPYFDRLDYVSVVSNEHLLALSFENLIRASISLRISFVRMIIVEFTRCFNGLLCVSCTILDIGVMSPLLWSFEERDKICVFFDLCCGTRVHLAFLVLVGLLDDFVFGFVDFLYSCIISSLFLIDIYELLILQNRTFYIRLRGLSILDIYDLSFLSCSGVLSRSLGLVWDCRLYSNYELYFLMTFDYCYCFLGDAYDRLYIRIFELKMCLLIVKQLFFNIFFDFGFVSLFDYLYVDITIESLILLFYSIWCISIPGLTFSVVEHPKGEYLLYIILYFCSCTRLRIRCSDFLHILSLDILIRGFMLHDIVAILGNLDVVFGSIDR